MSTAAQRKHLAQFRQTPAATVTAKAEQDRRVAALDAWYTEVLKGTK